MNWSEWDGWAAFLLALCVAVIGWLAGFAAFISGQAGMRHRMTTAERDIQRLKEEHSAWIQDVQVRVDEVNKAIQSVATRAEERHTELMNTLLRDRK